MLIDTLIQQLQLIKQLRPDLKEVFVRDPNNEECFQKVELLIARKDLPSNPVLYLACEGDPLEFAESVHVLHKEIK